MVSYNSDKGREIVSNYSLNPCCSGQWSRTLYCLVSLLKTARSLNPYCSGQWSRTKCYSHSITSLPSLNPYCSGQWSRTKCYSHSITSLPSLNPYCSGQWSRTLKFFLLSHLNSVLILIVVDNGLVPRSTASADTTIEGLNPYCSGQWSRTV